MTGPEARFPTMLSRRHRPPRRWSRPKTRSRISGNGYNTAAGLARIGQSGEVTQQRDAARRCQGEASIDEAPINRTFNRVGSYPLSQAIGLGTSRLLAVDAPDETTTIYTAAGFADLSKSPRQALPTRTGGTSGQ